MKRILTLAITACLCASAMAQSEFRDRHMAYKGFADIGLGSTFTNGESATTFTLTTSHGVQLNPNAFIGAGIGVNLATTSITDGSTVICPIFAQARYNILNTRISPYIDFKGGGSVGDFKGGYVEPSFGVSMPVANRFASTSHLPTPSTHTARSMKTGASLPPSANQYTTSDSSSDLSSDTPLPHINTQAGLKQSAQDQPVVFPGAGS